jgi:hypothetical protein
MWNRNSKLKGRRKSFYPILLVFDLVFCDAESREYSKSAQAD